MEPSMVNTFPISIDFTPPNRHGYAKGGLAQKAEEVRQAVDNRDTVLIHVNPEEYEQIKKMFGPARINPETGIPQFGWFSDIKDWIAPVATVAANVFAPGIGTAIGSGLSSALGLGLGEAASAALGSGVIGGGLGALTGGTKGALLGGALGAVSPYALNALGLTGTGGALSGLDLSSSLGLGTQAGTNALSIAGGVRDASIAAADGVTGGNSAAWTSSGGGLGSVLGGGSSLMKYAPLLLMGAALGGGGGQKQQTAAPQQPSDANTKTKLSNVEFNRKQTNPNVTTSYGYGPAANFFENNRLPSSGVVTAAEGRYVRGGGTGTSDSIPASLSDGEYVIDAQTVSMLGDGSSDAGAKKLDEMRHEIRKQKGGALAKGKFAPDAKSPLSYMKGA